MITVWFLCVSYTIGGHACMTFESAAACVYAEAHLAQDIIRDSACEVAEIRDPLWPNGYPPIPKPRP